MTEVQITVAIPCYNGEKTIERCVESILAQTYTNYELLIINDGSKDNTPAVIEELAKKDSRIRIITQENRGLSATRNRGIEEAKGEYISFIDADDYICPDYLDRLYTAITATGADLAVCKYYTSEQPYKDGGVYTIDRSTMYKELLIPNDNIAAFAWNRLYKLDIINDAGLRYDARIYGNEDALFNYQYLKYCDKVAVVDKALYHYIINTGSIMFSKGYNPKRILANMAFDYMLEDAAGQPYLEYVQVGAMWYNLILKRRIILSKARIPDSEMKSINKMLRLNPAAFMKASVPLKYKLALPFWALI